MKILVLCTGNSCRSQMAEGFLHKFLPDDQIFSAGTRPEKMVNPNAVKVMAESGIDISKQYPKLVDEFINDSFDYVITVCDNAKEACPVFIGHVKKRLHVGFEDPADAAGNEDQVLQVYRKVRDQIEKEFSLLFKA